MSAAHQDSSDAPDAAAGHSQPGLRVAAMSVLEEALRRALESASREQVIQRVLTVLPDDSPAPDDSSAAAEADLKPGLHGRAQKVSVSLPTELTEAVRARTGIGGFSRYITDALQERFKHDQLGDLLAELEAEHGGVPPEVREQTRQLWPNDSQ
jgi:hypothetical protein